MIYDTKNIVFKTVLEVSVENHDIVDGVIINKQETGEGEDYTITYEHRGSAGTSCVTIKHYIDTEALERSARPLEVLREVCEKKIAELRSSIEWETKERRARSPVKTPMSISSQTKYVEPGQTRKSTTSSTDP